MSPKKLPFVTPGEILAKEFLKPLGITEYRLAKDIGVPRQRINGIVHGKQAISADTAVRLGAYFGLEPEFWLNLQMRYDLLNLQREHIADNIKRYTENGAAPMPDFVGRSRAVWGDKPSRKPLSETIIDDREERL